MNTIAGHHNQLRESGAIFQHLPRVTCSMHHIWSDSISAEWRDHPGEEPVDEQPVDEDAGYEDMELDVYITLQRHHLNSDISVAPNPAAPLTGLHSLRHQSARAKIESLNPIIFHIAV